jgi:hypothetical protein
MKSRDQILEEIRTEMFSTRQAFFGLLERCAYRSEGVKLAWPDALTQISLEEWNSAYEGAMQWRDAQRRGDNARLNRKHPRDYDYSPSAGEKP